MEVAGDERILCLFIFSYEETEAQEITFPELEPSAMLPRLHLQLGDNSESNSFCIAGFRMLTLPWAYP